MLAEVALEALRFFDRAKHGREGLQIHSRYLRDLVNRHTRALPLRQIYSASVSTSCQGRERASVSVSENRDL